MSVTGGKRICRSNGERSAAHNPYQSQMRPGGPPHPRSRSLVPDLVNVLAPMVHRNNKRHREIHGRGPYLLSPSPSLKSTRAWPAFGGQLPVAHRVGALRVPPFRLYSGEECTLGQNTPLPVRIEGAGAAGRDVTFGLAAASQARNPGKSRAPRRVVTDSTPTAPVRGRIDSLGDGPIEAIRGVKYNATCNRRARPCGSHL